MRMFVVELESLLKIMVGPTLEKNGTEGGIFVRYSDISKDGG